jgi:adenylosuccinate synthase
MKTVPVCTSYEHGEPRCGDDFFTAKPVYTNVQGWNDARDLNQVQSFISFVEEQVGLKVSYISFGTGPNDMIKL